jgi:hypothetical protein
VMANRSDRRRNTPCADEERQSSCMRLGAGARIAHQGPMPIPREASFERPDIRVQSYLQPSNTMLANEGESIYVRATPWSLSYSNGAGIFKSPGVSRCGRRAPISS